jgi:predicted O-methyltransferase YrrM
VRGAARNLGASKALRSAFGRAGFDLIRRHYYSPIPDLASLSPEVWKRESELPGVRFNHEAGLEFVERELADMVREYAPPREPTGNPRDFYLDNGLYESGDAELLYAMIRRFAPARVIELGSGMSTLVIGDALAQREDNDQAHHIVCDPYPRDELRSAFESVAELRAVSATEVPLSEFAALGAGDVLFVDTTHTVKIGGEVNRIILEVLPILAPGVIVHVHDIYLPWEYPREFMEERNFFWNEQYLLQAFLAFNDRFEILFGSHALARRFPGQLRNFLPTGAVGSHPSAFWMRRSD